MSIRNKLNQYGSIAKFLHWLIFALVLIMLIYGYCLDYVPKDYQGFAYNVHKLMGLTVLTFMILRIVWSLLNPKPQLPFNTPYYQRIAAPLVQWGLNILLIVMPLAGWIGSVAAGRPPHLGTMLIGLPIAQSKEVSDTAFMVHNNVALILIALISIHVLAALYHHFIRRDNVLVRMS